MVGRIRRSEPAEGRQVERLLAGERLTRLGTDAAAEVGVGRRDPHRQAAVGWIRADLADVAGDGTLLHVRKARGVHDEVGLRHDPQVRGVVVEQPLRVPRLARQVGLRELGVETRVLDDARAGHVVGVRILVVGDEHHVRAERADHACHRVPRRDG
ncbi:MAG: hypothetical protein ACK56F_03560, partial [bacterium]